MEQKIKSEFINDPDALINLAIAHAEKGDDAKAREYFEKAIQLKPGVGGYLYTYGSYRLNRIVGKRVSEFKIQEKDIKELEAIEKMLTDALDAFEKIGNKKDKGHTLVNRCSTRALLKKYDDALTDISQALALDPKNTLAHVNKAKIHRVMHQHENAIKEYTVALELGANKDELLPLLIESTFSFKGKKTEEPFQILEKFYTKEELQGGNIMAASLLIDLYARAEKFKEANELLVNAYKKHGQKTKLLLAEADLRRYEGREEDFERINAFVIRNEQNVDSVIAELQLAQHYKGKGAYEEAINLYEKFVSDDFYDEITKDYLICLYKAKSDRPKNIEKCLNICKKLEAHNMGLPFVIEMQLAINQELDNIPECERLYATLIEKDKLNLVHQINYASLLMARGGGYTSKAKDILYAIKDRDLNEEGMSKVAKLLVWAEDYDEAIRFAFKVYEKNPNSLEPQLLYVNIFLNRTDRKSGILDSDDVKVGFYIRFKKDDREIEGLISDNPQASISRGEIYSESGLGKEMIGKKVKDSFETRTGEKIEILEIKSKYVKVFQELMDSINLNFPDEKAIQKMKFDPEQIKKSVKQLSEKQYEFLENYKAKRFPVNVLSHLTKRTLLETWSGIITSGQSPFYFALGSFEEQKAEQDLIRNSERIVIDILSLRTLMHLNRLDLLKKFFKEILVASPTLNEFDEKINSMKSREMQGFSTLAYRDGQYYYEDVTPDKIKYQIDFCVNARKIMTESLIVASLKNLPRLLSDKDEDIFGKPFIKTIQISIENNLPVYADDLLMRDLMRNEYKIKSFNTQNFLVCALERKIIDEKEYFEMIFELSKINYHYLSISGKMLFYIVSKNNFSPTKINELEPLLKILGAPETTTPSLINVLADFSKDLYLESLPKDIKPLYLNIVLSLMVTKEQELKSIKLFLQSVKSKLSLAGGVIMPQIQEDTRNWLEANYGAGGKIFK